LALAAVAMLREQLPVTLRGGADLGARDRLAPASSCAGFAFTRVNVGNVHALAHPLGGRYHAPLGLANAIMLPPVLRFRRAQVMPKLARLAQRARLGREDEPESKPAQRLLGPVEAMNRALGIPRPLDALREENIPALARSACREAGFSGPVPRLMPPADAEALLREVLQASPAKAARRSCVHARPRARGGPRPAAPLSAARSCPVRPGGRSCRRGRRPPAWRAPARPRWQTPTTASSTARSGIAGTRARCRNVRASRTRGRSPGRHIRRSAWQANLLCPHFRAARRAVVGSPVGGRARTPIDADQPAPARRS
jgi:hypothetical protein